jgi:hypothetical protein
LARRFDSEEKERDLYRPHGEDMPRWRRSMANTFGSGVTPARAWSMVERETPWACA